jgi:hypothetical protein
LTNLIERQDGKESVKSLVQRRHNRGLLLFELAEQCSNALSSATQQRATTNCGSLGSERFTQPQRHTTQALDGERNINHVAVSRDHLSNHADDVAVVAIDKLGSLNQLENGLGHQQ